MTAESDQPPSREIQTSPSVELPVGLTLQSLRQNIPITAQLIVRFENDDPLQDPLIFTAGSMQYELHQDTAYIVGLNPEPLGNRMLYLNPLSKASSAPEESNIPLELDQFLATSDTRERLQGLRILVSCPDFPVHQTLARLAQQRQDRAVLEAYDKQLLSQQAEITLAIQTQLESSPCAQWSRSSNCANNLQHLVYLSAASSFIQQYETDPGSASATEAVSNAIAEVLIDIHNILDRRVAQFQQALPAPRDAIGISLDILRVSDDSQSEGVPLVVVYHPSVGWSCCFPMGDCPSQAVAAIDTLFRERDQSATDFPNFQATTAALIESGTLHLDRPNRTLILQDASILRHGWAVFHGDDSITDAFETLRVMGNPTLGEQYFHMITFKQEFELPVPEDQPLIKLTLNDL